MTEAFERYKEALKAGHVALLRNRLEEALSQYRLAAEIADHRPLPHVSAGDVLLRMRRIDEALAAYATALGRDPSDEAALAGRARALVEAGRRGEAAEVLDRLADVQVAQGRHEAALESLRAALELSETSRRRRRAAEVLELARPARMDAIAAELAVTPPLEADATWGALEPPATEPPPAPEPQPAPVSEGDVLADSAEAANAGGRTDEAIGAWIAAAQRYDDEGRRDAALDVCLRALAAAPGSPAVHLALASFYLERGWKERGVEKLVLLDLLLALDGDEANRRALGELAARHAAGDQRLASLASRVPAASAD